MNDTISRQAAFDAIAVLVKEVNSRKRIESVRGKEAIEILDKYAQQELFNNNNVLRHPQCANRTKLGNCDPVGGFCTSVPKKICDVQSQRTGRWIDHVEDGYVECPFCHSATNCDGNKEELHFCFSCGAKMEGE